MRIDAIPTRYQPGRMSTMRSTFRTALVAKVTGAPFSPTTRRPLSRLPGVRRPAPGAPRRPPGPPRARVWRLGPLSPAPAADLARLRRRAPGSPETARLEALVGNARHLVYSSGGRTRSIVAFYATDYWRL